MGTQRYGAGIWHFATYVDRYATDGYGEARSLLAADSMLSLSVAAQLAPFSPTGSVKMRHAACC